jgi:hypothetical protein
MGFYTNCNDIILKVPLRPVIPAINTYADDLLQIFKKRKSNKTSQEPLVLHAFTE